jgi:hypothetical protein|tara:strand:+ start:450 stop:680 length:231 start_codon:yes stop_codon:yes gene_type:complete
MKEYRTGLKNTAIAIAITALILFAYVKTVEAIEYTNEIALLKENVVAHKLAMTYANNAIHTLYDETLFLKDKTIDL